MKMFYATWVEADGRFGFSPYDDGGHPITSVVRDALLAEEAAGKILSLGADGAPIAVDPAPPGADQLEEAGRAWRDELLLKLAGIRDRHRDQLEIGAPTTLTDEQFKELLVYMQALRDWPQSDDFPAQESRPIAPAWIADQTE